MCAHTHQLVSPCELPPPFQHTVLSMLVHRARVCVIMKALIMSWSSSGTLSGRMVTGRSDGLSIHWRELPTSVALLPFVSITFKHISWMLSRHSSKSVGLPPRKITSLLWPMKDDLGLNTPGVYNIPCKCGQVYIGQTSHSIEIRVKKHHWHIQINFPWPNTAFTWTIASKLLDTSILSTKSRHMDRMMREATEIELYPNNINREDGLCMSYSWKPLIHSLKGCRNTLPQDCPQDKNWHLLVPSIVAHPVITSWYNCNNDPLVALKRAHFFPLSVSPCPLYPFVSPCQTVAPPPLNFQPLAHFLVLSSLLSPLVWPSFTWSDQFLYFQQSFHAWLIHHPDDGGSTHLWNVGLLQQDYIVLYPRKLSSSNSLPW
jgi:hypothetical protein